MAKTGLQYASALVIAEELVEALRPGCERIEIGGSIRRQRSSIGDVEIVCIPKLGSVGTDLFDEPVGSQLDPILKGLVATGKLLSPHKNGERLKCFGIPARGILGFGLDLFITTPECWGVIFAIRTGSAEFAKKLVTQRDMGGWLLDSLNVKDGRVWRRKAPLETPEEADFLELSSGWVEPQGREVRQHAKAYG